MNETNVVTDKVRRGLLPWSYDGLAEAWNSVLHLEHTPKDDWNLRPARLLSLLDGFLQENYSRTRGVAHRWRFQEITWFLGRWESRLRAEGLVGDAKISRELLQVLVEAPFITTRGYEQDRRRWTFDIDDVLARVAAAEPE